MSVFGSALHFLRRSIARKLTLTLVGFVAITLLAAGLYLNRALERFAVDTLEARLASTGRLLRDDAQALLARGAHAAELRAWAVRVARPTRSRVTVIAVDGRVLGDSEVAVEDLPRVENHAGRPEVRAALAGRIGHDLRTSATIDVPLLYVALPIDDGGRVVGVLRLALPLAVVTASYATIHRVMLAGGLVALVVAWAIGLFGARRVTSPVVEMQAIARRMSEGDFALRAPVRTPDEIGALGRALNTMAARLREKIQDLEQEQAKATAILDGMIEGVIAVDARDAILFMNERARTIFGLGAARGERKPFLEVIRNVDLHAIFHESRAAGEGTVSRHELRLASPVERRLQVNAVPLRLAADELGVVMVLHDVTELRRLEQVRTEFVANVSHELRTPLTADRDRLAQIFINLVDNAVKYTPEGGRVTVSARPVAGGRVEVTVADTGIGIPPADLPRITERFYRVDRARSRELGGTGLGL